MAKQEEMAHAMLFHCCLCHFPLTCMDGHEIMYSHTIVCSSRREKISISKTKIVPEGLGGF